MNTFKKYTSVRSNWFTLVELIVVITILVILWTIAFINLGGFSGSARDATRVSDLTNITQGLEMTLVKNGVVIPPEAPSPGWVVTLTSSGWVSVIGYQWVAGATTLSFIKMSDARDPTDKKYYTYVTNGNYTKYQLLTLMEDSSTVTAYETPSPFGRGFGWGLIGQAFADYTSRFPATKGYTLGALLASSGIYINQPLQEIVTTNTTLDIQNFTGTLSNINIGNPTVYFTKTDFIPSTTTGAALSTALQVSMNNGGNGFSAPSTCPTGFVAVPGNKEFNQPGFCVSKYAMTYSDADVPNSSGGDRNTISYIPWKTPVSMPNKYPIADINQPGAIISCQSLWAGYHLITNNEWMTIARNIEQQGDNWSTGIVGSGGLYRGITSGNINQNGEDGVLGCRTIDSFGSGSRDYIAKPLTTDTTKFWVDKTDCDSKRQLKLSNNQIIWDISGNAWTHVNKGNTIDGSNFSGWLLNKNTPNINLYLLLWSDTKWEGATEDMRKLYGPSGSIYRTWSGMGNIHGTFNSDTANIFIRGGSAGDGTNTGIYALNVNWDGSTTYKSVGFRCAR